MQEANGAVVNRDEPLILLAQAISLLLCSEYYNQTIRSLQESLLFTSFMGSVIKPIFFKAFQNFQGVI